MQPEFVLALFPITAACIFIFALYMRFRRRELQHKERLAAIEKGVGLPELNDFEPGPRIYLLRGMIWLFSGLTLLVFLVGVSLTTRGPKSVEQRINQARFIERSGGTSEQVRQVENDTTPEVHFPLGFALLGLVPTGVGVAYLIFYRSEMKTDRRS